MAEKKREEVKENVEDIKEKWIQPEEKSLEEDEVKSIGNYDTDNSKHNEDDDESSRSEGEADEGERDRRVSEGGEWPDRHKKKKKKKSKKSKGNKQRLIAVFRKALEMKRSESIENNLLSIEQFFLTGTYFYTTKKFGCTLITRLLQAHFHAQDYMMYKPRAQSSIDSSDQSDSFLPSFRKPKDILAPSSKKEKFDPLTMSPLSLKFYNRRYYLFSKFDEGIKLDEESWYSVTPEEIASFIAKKCKCNCILDAFCGVGGNLIQFARNINQVYANDIDGNKIEMAKNNTEIYNVDHKISYINKDFLLLEKTKDFQHPIDIVFVSPPWGGLKYSQELSYDLQSMKPSFVEIVRKALTLADNLVIFLPRNIDIQQLGEMIASFKSIYSTKTKECMITVEALVYGERCVRAIIVYIGPLFQPKTSELFPKIKSMFSIPFDPYQSIIVQNIINAKSFSFCYEVALRVQGKITNPNGYIGKLKQQMTGEEWDVIKKYHKHKEDKGTQAQKPRALPSEPFLPSDRIVRSSIGKDPSSK